MDLLYFGLGNDSPKLEKEFKESIITVFPNVKLIDAYNYIKGYRQEVHLLDEEKDDYLSWIIGDGWLNKSLILQIMILDKEQKSEFERIFALAEKQYPQSFKSDV